MLQVTFQKADFQVQKIVGYAGEPVCDRKKTLPGFRTLAV